MRLGIDGSNIRAGGGVTHLVELLRALEPHEHGIERVLVWGGRRLLAQLPERAWLQRTHEPLLDRPLPYRLLWQQTRLSALAQRGCDLLFVPGGTYTGPFTPFVTMSRNLLPFVPEERQRYGLSWTRLRLHLLERSQTASFQRASGVIFLTATARQVVEQRTGPLPGQVAIVPHGVADAFRRRPTPQLEFAAYSRRQPFRWLYVSEIDVYKHQWHVVEAVAQLRRQGVPVALELVGAAYPEALRRLQAVIMRVDPGGEFIQYRTYVPYAQLAGYYHQADGFVFASSCENMPNILVEAMAAGLPIACSTRPPMPEILGDAGEYFDPEQPEAIARALYCLMTDPTLRGWCATRAYERAKGYSWARCARETFVFLTEVAQSVPVECV